jgi:hypothetical protein
MVIYASRGSAAAHLTALTVIHVNCHFTTAHKPWSDKDQAGRCHQDFYGALIQQAEQQTGFLDVASWPI